MCFLSYGLYSMSSAGGSVQPSAVQLPPLRTKYAACDLPDDLSGSAKWYAPRMMPALRAPLYCWPKYGLR